MTLFRCSLNWNTAYHCECFELAVFVKCFGSAWAVFAVTFLNGLWSKWYFETSPVFLHYINQFSVPSIYYGHQCQYATLVSDQSVHPYSEYLHKEVRRAEVRSDKAGRESGVNKQVYLTIHTQSCQQLSCNTHCSKHILSEVLRGCHTLLRVVFVHFPFVPSPPSVTSRLTSLISTPRAGLHPQQLRPCSHGVDPAGADISVFLSFWFKGFHIFHIFCFASSE